MTTHGDKRVRDGFDSAVRAQTEDKLDRWKFARELYGVAVTGPQEWSVRIGIYGEWGTGKTSLLQMIETMAEADNHLVVHFNPWSYSDSLHLWHGFVQAIERKLFPDQAKQKLPWWKKWKRPVAPSADWLVEHGELIRSCSDDRRVSMAFAAIEVLKRYLFSKRADLENALKHLGKRRLIVLVDDLDRAQSAMVPEILFAFKELLDVGGIAFVCAFDPIVVGKTLKRNHEGFEDGLKFLEKIIDYPRWLPDPTLDGLTALAKSEVEKYCSYVPGDTIQHAVQLLPRNPRAIKQFVRLLSLLMPQIDRHYDHELQWPTILATNVLKVRYPRHASVILESVDFWREISSISLMGEDNDGKKRRQKITEHLQRLFKDQNVLNEDDKKIIEKALEELTFNLDVWTGHDEHSLKYQANIAEAPAAVTWKEFDQFFEAWKTQSSPDVIDKWINPHTEKVGRLYNHVYRELLDAALRARNSTIGQAIECLMEDEMRAGLQKSDQLMSVIEQLVLELGQMDQQHKLIADAQLEQILQAMMYYIGFNKTDDHRSMRAREKTLLLQMTQKWTNDFTPWIRVLKPVAGIVPHEFRDDEAKPFYNALITSVMPKYARQILERFGDPSFIKSVFSRSIEVCFEIRSIILDIDGPLWKGLRVECLAILKSADANRAVHINAYEMFYWFNYMLRKEEGCDDTSRMKNLMKNQEIMNALWRAATIRLLSPRAVASLKALPEQCEKLGIILSLPEWWHSVLNEGETGQTDENNIHVAQQANGTSQ